METFGEEGGVCLKRRLRWGLPPCRLWEVIFLLWTWVSSAVARKQLSWTVYLAAPYVGWLSITVTTVGVDKNAHWEDKKASSVAGAGQAGQTRRGNGIENFSFQKTPWQLGQK